MRNRCITRNHNLQSTLDFPIRKKLRFRICQRVTSNASTCHEVITSTVRTRTHPRQVMYGGWRMEEDFGFYEMCNRRASLWKTSKEQTADSREYSQKNRNIPL